MSLHCKDKATVPYNGEHELFHPLPITEAGMREHFDLEHGFKSQLLLLLIWLQGKMQREN